MYNKFLGHIKFTFLAVLVSLMKYFRPFVVNIEVKTLNFGTCNYSFSYNF
jgi:hypothetical protein